MGLLWKNIEYNFANTVNWARFVLQIKCRALFSHFPHRPLDRDPVTSQDLHLGGAKQKLANSGFGEVFHIVCSSSPKFWMGQAQSDESSSSVIGEEDGKESPPDSLEALISEATAFGDGEDDESLDAKAQKALECPCIAGLRNGSCGTQFSEAFLCYLKSTSEEKGSDCVHPFVALQNCIKEHPDAFSNQDEDDNKTAKEEYKIIPPKWATQPNPKT